MSKMESLATIVDGYKWLTIVANLSQILFYDKIYFILGVCGSSGYTSGTYSGIHEQMLLL